MKCLVKRKYDIIINDYIISDNTKPEMCLQLCIHCFAVLQSFLIFIYLLNYYLYLFYEHPHPHDATFFVSHIRLINYHNNSSIGC